MAEILLYAAPAFLLLLGVELASYRWHPDDAELGYERRDTLTSLSMGGGYLVVSAVWKLVAVAAYAAVYTVAPWHLSARDPWTWLLLVLADDLAYYAYHRTHHEVRVLWASHVVHHSSQRYNLSTALRQTWTPMTFLPFWLPLALVGLPPWLILLEQSVSLIYQFFLHTERVRRLPAPIEWVFNTPSHHRVHHGSNRQYLDRNYGGILIVWDRLFGSFEPERERVRYGLTTNITTYRPDRVAFHEYRSLWADLHRARGWRARVGVLLRRPGWVPDAATLTGVAA